MVQILGWFRPEAARASRRKRSSALGSRATSVGRNLSATKRPSSVSSACRRHPSPHRQVFQGRGSARWFDRSISEALQPWAAILGWMGGQVNGSDLRQPRHPRLYRYPRAQLALRLARSECCLHLRHRTFSKSTRRSSDGEVWYPHCGAGRGQGRFHFFQVDLFPGGHFGNSIANRIRASADPSGWL